MKISDMIISGLLKKGVLYEGRNCDMEIEIPLTPESDQVGIKETKILVRFKAEHMSIRVEKE